MISTDFLQKWICNHGINSCKPTSVLDVVDTTLSTIAWTRINRCCSVYSLCITGFKQATSWHN